MLDEIEIYSPIPESVANNRSQQLNSVRRDIFNTASESPDNNNEINLSHDVISMAVGEIIQKMC